MPTDNQGTRSRSGGMSVSLASPDGRVVGGGVAGLLVAASPVQVSDLPLFSIFSRACVPECLKTEPYNIFPKCIEGKLT